MWHRAKLRKRLTRRERQKRKVRLLRSAGAMTALPSMDDINAKFSAAKEAGKSVRRQLMENLGAAEATT